MKAEALFTGHKGPVYAMVAGTAPGTFLSGSGDGMVVQWDIARPNSGEVIVNVGQAIFSLCLMPHGQLLYVGTEGGGLHVVDLVARKELHLYDVHRKGIFSIIALPHQRLACAGGDGTLSIWLIGENRELHLVRQFPVVEEKLRDLCLSPDKSSIVVACGDGTLRILDTELYNERYTLKAHPTVVDMDTEASFIGALAIAYHPTKPVMFSAGKDGHVRLWRTDMEHAQLGEMPAHKAGIYRIAFSSNGRYLATASRDKSAKVWSAVDLNPVARSNGLADGHTHSVNTVLWMGDSLLSAGDDRRIIQWRMNDR